VVAVVRPVRGQGEWGAATVAEDAYAAALHPCDQPVSAPSATKTRVAPQAAAETRGDSLLALS